MPKRKVTAAEKVEGLAVLQWKLRKDPLAYQTEFIELWQHFDSARERVLADPLGVDADSLATFREHMDLIAHCAEKYPEITATFPDSLRDILIAHHATLDPTLREKIVTSLSLLRRKEVIDSAYLLPIFWSLLISTPSKTLRTLLYQKIISDVRESNTRAKNHKVNRTLQQALYNIVTDKSTPKALWAVKVVRDLWRRRIWDDAKPVDIMRQAAMSDDPKTVASAVRFFLGSDKERDEFEDDSSDEEAVDVRKVKHQIGINKKSKKSKKILEKATEKVKRQERKKSANQQLNFSALHLLLDPQGFCESLFEKHLQNKKSKLPLETKLDILQLVTRLVGLHKLTILPLYSYFTSHLTPRQQSVTSFLASLAQATHSLVPPETIEVLLQKIANEFVSEASNVEVCAAGINAIREICARQPLAMNETLLQDLVEYRKSKDKGVSMAAKGLLSLYREKGAEMLRKKDRGKDATIGLKSGEVKQQKYGEEQVGEIEGLELLAKWKEEEKKRKRAEKGLPDDPDAVEKNEEEDDDDFNESDWEVASTDSDESGEWIRVAESDDEAEPEPKKRKVGDEAEQDEEDKEPEQAIDFMKLATTQVLTPADLAKLKELRLEASINKAMGSSKRKEMEARHIDEGLTAEQIEAPAKLRKATKEERLAMVKEGKPNREEHKSTAAIRKSKKEAEGKSTTNKEKARRKNFLMTLGKAKSKQKRSLVTTRNVLKAHVERSKSGGRRRNGKSR
ncbi:SDA1-domain-containing protein [Xylaria bambusicola]|uniref:SDA1-domain-containing protein n=1 Tax=Xylaria bambusicola TaxID=326684 RepID=UPI00200869E5|nr:SDA1-domain-containing protein [Xylaria bambusicola]KAI0518393.1 SDA1-domain-containing protein [Xylaria bambusicola]